MSAHEAFRVEVRDDVDDAEWARLVASDPRAHVLQRPAVLRLAAGPGWTPRWFEVRDADGALRAGMGYVERSRLGLRSVVAGAVGLYGGPVAAPEDQDAESRLADAFADVARWRTLHRELVWAHPDPPRGSWARLQSLDAAVFDVDAEDFEAWWKGVFPKSRRNECNRSDRRGLVVDVEHDSASLEAFHPLYVERSATWGIEPQPLDLLQRLVDGFEEFFVFVTRGPEGRVIGAHVCIDLGDELFAWVGTTERRKDVFPSTVIVREEARWCHTHGRRRLNLGSSIGRSGVKDYKRMLGARLDRRWIVDADARPWRRRRT